MKSCTKEDMLLLWVCQMIATMIALFLNTAKTTTRSIQMYDNLQNEGISESRLNTVVLQRSSKMVESQARLFPQILRRRKVVSVAQQSGLESNEREKCKT